MEIMWEVDGFGWVDVERKRSWTKKKKKKISNNLDHVIRLGGLEKSKR